MPNPTITTTYAGQWAGKYVSAALLSAPTIEGGGVTGMHNVKFKAVIQRLETTDFLKDATCDFTPVGTVDLTERVLEVKDLQVNMTLCKSEFHRTWQSIEMGYSSFDTLPKSFADYLIAYAAAAAAAAAADAHVVARQQERNLQLQRLRAATLVFYKEWV